ncbi:origin recognition complex subunit 4 [Brevipalpus obovatus]|uniref:origin recognition complex subunit 4 n=1 Tax=Brevipalpus obovatus TaxID=246614 RepID=UPI003D9E3288
MAMTLPQLDGETIKRLVNRVNLTIDDQHLIGYEKEKQIVLEKLSRALKEQDSSALIIHGWRGSGKRTLLNSCLQKLNISKGNRHHYLIRLDGLLHPTDAAALNVIGHELEMDLRSSSHVGQVLQEKCSSGTKKSFIFILNEFDIFCRRQQTLLYTLFDALQFVQGMCIIGITAKHDCLDYGEKRVRSRMNVATVLKILTPFNSLDEYVAYANTLLDSTFDIDLIRPLLTRQYGLSRTPRELRRFLTELLVNWNSLRPVIGKDISKSRGKSRKNCPIFQFPSNDSKIDALKSLTLMELAIIVTISYRCHFKRCIQFQPVDLYPLLSNIPSPIICSQKLCNFALHRLVEYGLLILGNGSSVQRSTTTYISDWTLLSLNVSQGQIQEILKTRNDLPTKFDDLKKLNL